MADFPGSVWAGWTLVDLVDFFTAARANAIADEVVALEDYLITTTRADNTALLGPATGGPLAPTWRTFVGADIPQATTTTRGTIEFATDAEVATGSDAGRCVTPAGLRFDQPLVPAALKGVRLDANGDLLLPNEASVGIGGALERIEFYTAGYIAAMGANFGVGTVTPGALLEVDGIARVKELQINYAASAVIANEGLPHIYGTLSGGAYPFSEAGHLIMQPRTSVGRDIFFYVGTPTPSAALVVRDNGNVGVGTTSPGSLMELSFATEDLELVDAGSAAATEQDWIEVQVGGVTGYIRVFAAK